MTKNVDVDGVQVSSELSDDGRYELPDPVPMQPPIGYSAEPTLADMIRTMVRRENFNAQVAAAGFESFEEGDDFDIEDDPVDPLTPYERYFEPPPPKAPDVAKPLPEPPAAAATPEKEAVQAPPAAPLASTTT